MADIISKARRSKNMAQIKSKNMKPEMVVRRLVHGMGFRYSLHKKDLPGKPDLVFPSRKKVIFVHGCFWHQHNKISCPITRKPKSNIGYWNTKLDKNVTRDKENQRKLKKMGWKILTVWECEIKKDRDLRKRISKFLSS